MAQTVDTEWQVRRPNGQAFPFPGNGSWTADTADVERAVNSIKADLNQAGAVDQMIRVIGRTVTTDTSEEFVVSETKWPA